MASAARRVLSFKSAQASCRRNIHCAEIHSRDRGTIAAPGPPLSRGKRRESVEESEKRGRPIWRRALSSSSRRTPGSRGHGTLDGNQKDIEPPGPPQHGACCSSRGPERRAGGKLTVKWSINPGHGHGHGYGTILSYGGAVAPESLFSVGETSSQGSLPGGSLCLGYCRGEGGAVVERTS